MNARVELKRTNDLLRFFNNHALISMEMVVLGLLQQIEIEEMNSINNPYGELERIMYGEAKEELRYLLAEWNETEATA